MKNKITIFGIKGAWNEFIVKIAFYRIKGKKCKSHQHTLSNNNRFTSIAVKIS